MSDLFKLYDLEVIVEGDPSTFVCSHRKGLGLKVVGENLTTAPDNGFSMYALSALLPLLPVKQRPTDENDWISTDEVIACPDPHCGAKFRIIRKGGTTFKHSEVTKVPLKKKAKND